MLQLISQQKLHYRNRNLYFRKDVYKYRTITNFFGVPENIKWCLFEGFSFEFCDKNMFLRVFTQVVKCLQLRSGDKFKDGKEIDRKLL